MSKAQTTLKLPAGKYTISIAEWKRLAKQVETALDARVHAFDPDFGVSLKDGRGTFSLPLWAAKQIATACRRLPMSSETEREAAHAFIKAHADWLADNWSMSPEGREYKDKFDRHVATLAAPAQAAKATVYVECRECSECGEVTVNDDNKLAACNRCNWRGPSPAEDRCPSCHRPGTMTTACSECGARTHLLASADLGIAPAAQAAEAGEARPAMTRAEALDLLVEHTPYGSEGAELTHSAVDAIVAASTRPAAETGEAARLREALGDATVNLAGAASAYRAYARRHKSQGPAMVDAFFSTRASDFDRAVERARAAFKGDSQGETK